MSYNGVVTTTDLENRQTYDKPRSVKRATTKRSTKKSAATPKRSPKGTKRK